VFSDAYKPAVHNNRMNSNQKTGRGWIGLTTMLIIETVTI